MINAPYTKIVKINDLLGSPVPVHIHSIKQTEHVSTSLDSNLHEHTVRIALLDSKMYIIDGHMIVQAYHKHKRKRITVKVYKVKNLNEVLILHVNFNMNNPPSPIQLVRIIQFMRKSGDDDKLIAKSLRTNRFITNMLRYEFDDDALKELEITLWDISKTYYSLHHMFPQNLIEWVFKQPKENQHAAAIALKKSIKDSSDIPERKFTWPTPLEIRVIQRYNEIGKTPNVKAVPLVSNEGMRGRPKNTIVASAVISNPPSESEIRKISKDNTPTVNLKIAFRCPHGALMYVDGKSRAYHVEDNEKDNIVRLEFIDSEDGTYAIKKEALDFMNISNGIIRLKMCTPKEAGKYLATIKKKDINICILSTSEL